MISVWKKGGSRIRDFYVGSCPVEFEEMVEVIQVQADGHELDHIYHVYPHLFEKFQGKRYKGILASVILFFGEDAQYAVNAFSEFKFK